MNEAETRAELIDPMLARSGWGTVEGSRVLREYQFTDGRLQVGGRTKPMIADYLLVYRQRRVHQASLRRLPESALRGACCVGGGWPHRR